MRCWNMQRLKGKYSHSCLYLRWSKIAQLIDSVYLYGLHWKKAADMGDTDGEKEVNGKKERS